MSPLLTDQPTPCPKCGRREGVIRGKAEFGGGWVCWAKRGGCGYSWAGTRQEEEPPPPPMEELEAGESLGQAVQRIQSQAPVLPVPPPSVSVKPVLEPALGTVEVVTGLGNEIFPPRTTWLVKEGHLQILNRDGAVIRVYNNAVWNQVRFNLP